MITFLVEENNNLSQNSYDFCINNIQSHQLTCSCGHSGCLTIHGSYKRKVKTKEGSFMLVVCRVKCSQCGKTHAILPSSIVPYSQITLACCCRIISDYNNNQNVYSSCEDYPDVDENNVKSVIRRFLKHWKQRLISESIHLFPIRTLILACFSCYSAQFMQIHRTLNIPHLKTT